MQRGEGFPSVIVRIVADRRPVEIVRLRRRRRIGSGQAAQIRRTSPTTAQTQSRDTGLCPSALTTGRRRASLSNAHAQSQPHYGTEKRILVPLCSTRLDFRVQR